jgi:hypothetical protein
MQVCIISIDNGRRLVTSFCSTTFPIGFFIACVDDLMVDVLGMSVYLGQ